MDVPSDEDRRVVAGRALRRLREGAGWSQREAAERSGVNQALVSKAERGEGSEESLRALSGAYGAPGAYQRAPVDPVRRKEWFDERNRLIAQNYRPGVAVIGAGKRPGEK